MRTEDRYTFIIKKKDSFGGRCVSLDELRCGDLIYLSGVIYTARDQAHMRMMEALNRGEELPVPLESTAIYYAGPSPEPPGKIVGSIGPTTSGRMDNMTVPLLKKGLKVMIGKGKRSRDVTEEMKRQGAVYLAAVGGAGALYSKKVKSTEITAYEELGPEAIRKLKVEDMPLIVAVDGEGNSLYERDSVACFFYETSLGKIGFTEEKGSLTGLHLPGEALAVIGQYKLEETPLIKEAYRQLNEYLEGDRRNFDIPLDPKGTEFQKKVWEELMKIPYGEAVSYGEIAKRVGTPRGARAVGLANNRNPIAIIIPCHRVIGADGRLVGYGGGLHIKKALLDLEGYKYKG